ncbi:hypothetical protein IFM58399_02406 [Aspergillus lentulus]|uniref:Serine hydrolase domain-containing protein n=1 Tax=Aspergillus lentulus TaxID=293939 RepID=A0ABQ0ZTG2_ASPLE|nr:uncharacterized protein IFM58399_02406 [Aspergillus lentulus]GFF29879.1 hypothetical protein IFM58399_02406 [Aspergillus lentulus]GFF59064.1 hypothetical protein IFM62136_04033 [Aspergillus lentulus]GFF63958.1 hypothetical protein IFM60648_01099 [Aspergillus lentulus]GFF67739.1 hypothetical protein IFM47457_01820 [Aspergillus lentulus]GFF99170.1 hypothetical protein IFM61392_00685 [Aspergillus lentulus]
MMKVLCLHGKGTSGAIFKSQTATFRSHLNDLHIDFDFIDGRYPSTAAAGIDLFYPAPYYSFWEDDSPEAIQKTCTWLKGLIAERGPYDAVMMFSQGCALGTAMLLLHQAQNPTQPPPFKAAIFICGGPPLKLIESIGFQISDAVKERDRAGREALAMQAHSASILTKGSARWTGDASGGGAVDEEELRGEIRGPFKVGIPTVHVYGSKDPRYAAGVQLSGICESGKRRVFDHGGGHEIPRTDRVSRTIADLVRWVLLEVCA